jgi:hypothetical protein
MWFHPQGIESICNDVFSISMQVDRYQARYWEACNDWSIITIPDLTKELEIGFALRRDPPRFVASCRVDNKYSIRPRSNLMPYYTMHVIISACRLSTPQLHKIYVPASAARNPASHTYMK